MAKAVDWMEKVQRRAIPKPPKKPSGAMKNADRDSFVGSLFHALEWFLLFH